MLGTLYLAWRYLTYHWLTTIWLVGCISLTLYLPIASRVVVQRFQLELQHRAASTPLIVGAKGSRFELAINALHFTGEPPESLTYGQFKEMRDTELASVIPLHVRYRTRSFSDEPDGYAIVGTSLDYFSFRGLHTREGNLFAQLGDCVIGSEVARRQSLRPGDVLMSQTQNAYDLVASQPLKMKVVGVLNPSHSDDDLAVFVDVKTAWVIEGLGHGHEDLQQPENEQLLLGKDGEELVANAAVTQYIEITPENISSFHFHGNPNKFPITAVIAMPHDKKSGLLFEGNFVGSQQPLQVIHPTEVMDELLQRVFRARRFFDVAVIVVTLVTTLFVALVALLSRRLREREMNTLFKIGCAPYTILGMQLVELSIVVGLSLLFAGSLAAITVWIAPQLIRQLVF